MEWAATILALLLLLREYINSRQKDSLKEELSKSNNSLATEKVKNAATKSKSAKENYHNKRDAYGRFRPGGDKSGRS